MLPDAPKSRAENPSALPPGTRLGEFELLSLLGVGGFGIVYLAFDHALEREVAVKEYMPASLAGRTETMHVSVRSQSDAETFALGLKSFVNEARLLARFDHPSLLKVLRFWEANGTAYMAMPVMRGRTVKELRLDMAGPPGERWLRDLLEPLLGAIERLHSEGVYHRDIAPDNIQIEPDGHPVLLDFGAARRVISDKSQTLTAILKPAYAPIEQYAEVGSVKQGPWTDLYALGATLHFLMLGRPPPPATARAVHDEASALTLERLPDFSANFLHIVDWMLAPRPTDRPQSVAALREVLAGHALPPRRRDLEPPPSQWDRTVVLTPAPPRAAVEIPFEFDDQATVVMPRPPHKGSLVVPAVAPAAAPPLSEPALSAPPVSGSLDSPPAPTARSRLLLIALGLGAVGVAVAAVVLWPRTPVAPSMAEAAASAAAVAAAVAAAASVAEPLPATPRPESAVTTVILQAAPAPAPQAARPPPPVSRTPAERQAATAPAAVVVTPAPEPPKPQAAVVVPPPAPVAASVTAPAPAPPKPVATGPEARCVGRNPVMYFVCMERECLRSEFAAHTDCLAWRKEAKRE